MTKSVKEVADFQVFAYKVKDKGEIVIGYWWAMGRFRALTVTDIDGFNIHTPLESEQEDYDPRGNELITEFVFKGA